VIAHIVLFQPRADLSESDKRRVVAALTDAAQGAPMVKRCRVGKRVLHRLPGYEQAMSTNYEYAAIFEFDDLEGLRAYLRHPAHHAIGGHFTSAASAALAYDYELADVSDASRLL
jgi:hypothetical protein